MGHGSSSQDFPVPDSPILYQNESRSVVLLDIPTSIALSQVAEKGSTFRRLLSCSPLSHPYSSNEPKSESARERVRQSNKQDNRFDQEIQQRILNALSQIQSCHRGDWCLSRYIAQEPEPSKEDHALLSSTSDSADLLSPIVPPLILSSHLNQLSSYEELYSNVVCNLETVTTTLAVRTDAYLIPPLSCFLLSRVEDSQPLFTELTSTLLPATESQVAGSFDFILLDPPCPNRSVRRAREYRTSENQRDNPWATVSSFLCAHLSPEAFVGVWVTNKASVRDQVLNTFLQWNVFLTEIWVWVKTTKTGDLILSLDALWRKPYEILLLGRKACETSSIPPRQKHFVGALSTARVRVIAAVPDVHSRKPCVKELIESFLPLPAAYRALEVFARNLTTGWWSLGDEVLKYNRESYWEVFEG